MNDWIFHLQQALSQVASIAVVVALTVLWLRMRSGWILLALIGELGALACSLAFTLFPAEVASMMVVRLLWPLNYCIFAFGLLGYAFSQTTRARADGAQP